jgi:hypothetical protein
MMPDIALCLYAYASVSAKFPPLPVNQQCSELLFETCIVGFLGWRWY